MKGEIDSGHEKLKIYPNKQFDEKVAATENHRSRNHFSYCSDWKVIGGIYRNIRKYL